MSATVTHPTTTARGVPAQPRPAGRARSRRTRWVVSGAAAAVIAASGAAVAVLSADDPPAPAVDTSWSPSADAAESSHGQGPLSPAARPWQQGTDTAQSLTGLRGALRDGAGNRVAP